MVTVEIGPFFFPCYFCIQKLIFLRGLMRILFVVFIAQNHNQVLWYRVAPSSPFLGRSTFFPPSKKDNDPFLCSRLAIREPFPDFLRDPIFFPSLPEEMKPLLIAAIAFSLLPLGRAFASMPFPPLCQYRERPFPPLSLLSIRVFPFSPVLICGKDRLFAGWAAAFSLLSLGSNPFFLSYLSFFNIEKLEASLREVVFPFWVLKDEFPP